MTGLPAEGVGLCCPVSYYPLKDLSGMWSCVVTNPCYPEPTYPCGYEYSSATFVDWASDTGCLNSSSSLACCNVVQFGSEGYWSDTDNVKVCFLHLKTIPLFHFKSIPLSCKVNTNFLLRCCRASKKCCCFLRLLVLSVSRLCLL